jgi:hypothetical protein
MGVTLGSSNGGAGALVAPRLETPPALILRRSRRLRLEGCSSALWTILRDAASRLLRMRAGM